MTEHNNLILVGFMGTGKTSVGKAVAQALGFSYIDTDDVVEEMAGKKISRIFAEEGEPHFRDLETEALRSLASLRHHVVSTGGGVVLRDENWEAMRHAGLVVCLAADPEVIYERTRHESHRPLLQTEDPMARIRELLENRLPYYARADETIDTTDLTIEQVVEQLLERWRRDASNQCNEEYLRNTMANNSFDIAVIGSGPGGYIAALKAAQLGARVAIVEKSYLGGTCLNNGCIPSKALLASAEWMHNLDRAAKMGIMIDGQVSPDWTAIQRRKDRIVARHRAGIKQLLEARKVAIHKGHGALAAPGRVVVRTDSGETEELEARRVILAPGSVPRRLPGWPEDPERIGTTDEALHWKTLPASLLIVGGGVIGCEFACMMQPFGVEVTIVEMLPRLLPELDPELGSTIQRILTGRGVRVHTETTIDDFEVGESGCGARLSNGESIEAERTLIAVGRAAYLENLGLNTAGIETERGFVRVNDRMETNVANHYCIGDANGRILLAHAASAQAMVAVNDALGRPGPSMAPVPMAVYTFPEIASVGLAEHQVLEKGIPAAIGHFPLAWLGKAQAAGETDGFAKVIRHRETGGLLGMQMIGHNAIECMAIAGDLLHRKATAAEALEIVFAHPSMSESIREATEDSMGEALHAPPREPRTIG